VGYHPQVILAGRRINDSMGEYIASKLVKLLISAGSKVRGAKIGILGLTFKENVPDIRNSRVPEIIQALEEYGIDVKVCDPLADAKEAQEEYGVTLVAREKLQDLDGVVLAISHREFEDGGMEKTLGMLARPAAVIDIKGMYRG